MKKFNLLLLLTVLSLSVGNNVYAGIWQDTLDQLTNTPKKTTPAHSAPRGGTDIFKKGGLDNLSLEHAQQQANKASIKATESANATVTAINNAALHLNGLKHIAEAAQHLNNISAGRGNSLEEAEKAKQLLHDAIPEARKLKMASKEAAKQLEKTIRATYLLHKHLGGSNAILKDNPTLAKIWDTIKNTTDSLNKTGTLNS